MAKKKKLTPAQREKKQLAAAERAQQKKRAVRKTGMIAGAILVVAVLAVILIVTALSDRKNGTYTTSGNAENTTANTTAPTSVSQTAVYGLPETGDGATLETAVATHIAKIEIEDYGTVTLELYGNTAPITVANFVSLAEMGFYEGLTFHRIIDGFMMQGGAPNADSPVISNIVGEFSSNGYENNLLHKRGVISMARSSVMNSASSQFFIMHADKPHLDGDYAAFGMVIEGIEVVDKICEAAQPTDGNGSIAEKEQPVILSVTVTALQ